MHAGAVQAVIAAPEKRGVVGAAARSLRVWRHRRAHATRVLILGTGALAASVIDEVDGHRAGPFVVTGVVEEFAGASREIGRVTCLGTLDALEEILDEVHPGVIVMALANRRRAVPDALLLAARMGGVVVEEAATFLERLTGKLAIERLTMRSMVLSDGFPHAAVAPYVWVSQMLTRAVGMVAAAIGLVILAPLFALIALLLKLDSPGPVFFRQPRVGRGARPFGLIKFRTMRHDQAHVSEWVCDNADRITRVGRLLRRFRLDELPQLLHVLTGAMDLVGPRPHPLSNYDWFLESIPFYQLRAAVRPGITGWAQVRYGYANSLEEETEKMRYDLYYIKHRSIGLDVRILFATVVLLLGDSQSHRAVKRGRTVRAHLEMWPGVAARVSVR